VSLPNDHRYELNHCTRQSPYLQELCVYFGQFTCYASAEELLTKVLRTPVSDSSIFRITNQIGGPCQVAVPESYLHQATGQAVYAMADGSMVFTRQDGWKEVKVGRIFCENHHGAVSKDRSQVHHSLYVTHLGGHEQFEERFAELLDPLSRLAEPMIFISDGALWIRDFVSTHYPDAVQILDFYHVKEHLGEWAASAFSEQHKRSEWVERMAGLLLESDWQTVLDQVRCGPLGDSEHARKLAGYLESNAYRMDYRRYRHNGWLIGSGPIEAAHRTVVQQRLKLSGQRWTIPNAQNVLNLRACNLSGQWDNVVNKIRTAA
jgi:hypothetical protein